MEMFILQLGQTCRAMAVKEELQRTQFLISEDSLQHSGEYHARLQVLQKLGYVDDQGTCTYAIPVYKKCKY